MKRLFVLFAVVVGTSLALALTARAGVQDPAAPGTTHSQTLNGGTAGSIDECRSAEVAVDARRNLSFGVATNETLYVTVLVRDSCVIPGVTTMPIAAQGEVTTGFSYDVTANGHSGYVRGDIVLNNYGTDGGVVNVRLDVSFVPEWWENFGQSPNLGGPVHVTVSHGHLAGAVSIGGTNFLTDGADGWSVGTLDSWQYLS